MKPAIHRQIAANYPFLLTLQTRFSDMDTLEHLNNVAIAGLYEEARVRFHREVLEGAMPRAPDMRTVVASLSISYLHEGFYPDQLACGTGIVSIGRSSYVVGQAFFQNGQCIGVCDTVLAQRKEGAAALVTPELRAGYEKLLIGGAVSSQ
ncbi:MAG: acyl-CoA thioesterase [Caulobacterales bacterium]